MNALIEVLSGPAWREILLTLAHSLWQGAAIALVLALLLRQIAGNRPNVRYLASLAALAGLVLACLITWSILDLPVTLPPAAEARVAPVAAVAASPAANVTATFSVSSTGAEGLPWPPLEAASAAWWQTAAAMCSALWIAGAGVMLLRMICLVSGARRIARRPPLADPRVLELVEHLRRQLGILRRVIVVEATTVGPAVLGVLRPVLLLPPAICGDLSAECLEAVLAHELAHIRRHDYLINLGQMLVEAALFFNPAVWWISRQIRREREACCDALAVRITGQPLTYADALAAWVEHAAAVPELAIGFANRPRGGVLDRIQRLLVAGHRPELGGSWPALGAGLSLSLVLFAALWIGTRAGVALAAEILSHAERIRQLADERGVLRPLKQSSAEALLSGVVRTADGQPLPPRIELTAYVQRTDHSRFRSAGKSLTEPDFSLRAPWGETWLVASTAGYAPCLIPPFKTEPGQTLADLDLVLEPGFAAAVQVIDPAGVPVPKATVRAALDYSGAPIPTGIGGNADDLSEWQADERGLVSADHLADFNYQLSVSAPGFQTLHSASVRFAPGKNITQVLTPVPPTSGQVVSTQGDPIPGAIIRRARFTAGFINVDNPLRPVLATTGADGRFTLDSLDSGANFGFIVEAPDGARLFVPQVRAGETALRWVVGPPVVFTGRLAGDSARFLSDGAGATPIVYRQTVVVPKGKDGMLGFELDEATAQVTSVAGQPQVRLERLFTGPLTLRFGEGEILVSLDKPATEITLNVPLPRRVALRFVGDRTGLSPQGEIAVNISGPDRLSNQNIHAYLSERAIEDGLVEFEAYVGGEVSYGMENVVGYSFEQGSFRVPAGSGTFVHDVSVIAAGAIRGQILTADGQLAARFSGISVGAHSWPASASVAGVHLQNIEIGDGGECFLSPLPLPGSYVLRASRGYEVAFSQPVRLDADHPHAVVRLQLSRARKFPGRVLGPHDEPLAGADVRVELRSAVSPTRYMNPVPTDSEGRFELNISSGNGDYWLHITPAQDFQSLDAQLPVEDHAVDLRPMPGHVIEGRLLDTKTGEPLEGVQIAAQPSDPEQSRLSWHDGPQPTADADGRFRFSTLAEGTYRVYPIGAAFQWTRVVRTGESIELRAHRN